MTAIGHDNTLAADEQGAAVRQFSVRFQCLGTLRHESAIIPVEIHRRHVTAGVIYLTVIATRVGTGYYDRHRGGNYEMVEIAGLYWHFVDLVWVFIFAFFYLW